MLQQVMLRAVRVGSRVAQRAQRSSQETGKAIKPDSSPVTEGDFSVQACVSHILSQAFPETKLLAEEDDEGFTKLPLEIRRNIVRRVAEEFPELNDELKVSALIGRGSYGKSPDDRPPCFVLDPIDGTKGFLRGEQYSVCLGYLSQSGQPSASVIGCPNMPPKFFTAEKASPNDVGYIFDAVVGQGVRMRRLEEDTVLKEWRSTDNPKPSSGPIIPCESFEKSHTKGNINELLFQEFGVDRDSGVLRIDSQVKFGCLLRGDANVYVRFTGFDLCIWDVLPGYVLVVEAGGKVTDKRGDSVDFTLGRTIHKNSLIATSPGYGEIHDRIVAAIAKLEAPQEHAKTEN